MYIRTSARRFRLGELLLQNQVITQEQLEEALHVQKETGERLGEILCRMGYTTEEQIGYHLARQLGVPYLSLKSLALSHEVVQLIPRDIAVRHTVVAIDKIGQFITIAMADPLAEAVRRQIAELTNLKVQFVVSTSQEIQEIIERYYAPTLPDEEVTPSNQEETEEAAATAEGSRIELGIAPPDASEEAPAPDALPPKSPEEPSPIAPSLQPRQEDFFTPSATPGPVFSPDFTFTSFVFPEDDGRIQKAVAWLCYEAFPAGSLLVIWGKVGMGKTHLLHAIGNFLRQMTPPRAVEYLDAREVVLRLQPADSHHQVCEELCRELAEAEVVLLDNWHLLAESRTTQIVATLLLEYLLLLRVAIACALVPGEDYPPALRSLLESGIQIQLQMPGPGGQLKILRALEKLCPGEGLPPEELETLVQRAHPNIRALIADWKRARFDRLSLPHNPFLEGALPH